MRSVFRLCFVVVMSVSSYQAAASGLDVSLEADCPRYGMEDHISLSVAIENQSNDPVVLYSKLGWGGLGGLDLKVARQNGEIVPPKYLDHDMVIPSTLQMRDYYTTLFESQFIGATRTDQVSEIFPGPGDYKVWVEYLSPVPIATALVKENFWSTEDGRIVSRPISLTVVEHSACK